MNVFEYLTDRKKIAKRDNFRPLARLKLTNEEKAFLGLGFPEVDRILKAEGLSIFSLKLYDYEVLILRDSYFRAKVSIKSYRKFFSALKKVTFSIEELRERFPTINSETVSIIDNMDDSDNPLVSIQLVQHDNVLPVIESNPIYNEVKLYLMVNELGLLKIGISISPIKRCSSLVSSSGMKVVIVAIWEVSIRTRIVEGFLHSLYKDKRLRGEWFESKSITPEKIEEDLQKWKFEDKPTLDFRRVYTNLSFIESYY